jgi:acyl-CoA reductase-like NAD-dependent aldehyde dehydrogenase
MNLKLLWAGHLVAGELQKPTIGTKWVSFNPSRGTPLLEVVSHKQVTLDAISSADDFYKDVNPPKWQSRIELISRLGKALEEYREEILSAYTVEVGKPKWESILEVEACLDYLSWVTKNSDFIRDHIFGPARLGHLSGNFSAVPAGVAIGYLAFSSPLTNFIFYTVAALQANCPIIIYTSRQNLVLGSILTRAIRRIEAKPGQIQLIFAGFSDFKQALLEKRVAAVLYTGSRDHCEEIRMESRIFPERRLILQSGGKNAVIVDTSCNLAQSLKLIATGAFRSAGQLCSSTNRVFVQEDLLPTFTAGLKDILSKLTIGATDDGENPFMGPLYSSKSVERFLKFQTMAAREAKETLQWGKAIEGKNGGYFVRPGVHLINDIDDTSSYQGTVLFGPDIALYTYKSIEQSIEKANCTNASFSLAWHGTGERITPYLSQIYAPNVLINLPTTELEACLPLAGKYSSGFHRFHGPSIAHYLLHPQVIQTSEALNSKLASIPEIDC